MNGPLLFIDTISENVNSFNQEFFDSRIKYDEMTDKIIY